MGLGEVMGSAGDVLDEVEVDDEQLRDIADTAQRGRQAARGQSTISRRRARNLRGMTEGNRERLDRAIVRFERSATMLDSLLTRHYADLDSSLAALGRAGGRVEIDGRQSRGGVG